VERPDDPLLLTPPMPEKTIFTRIIDGEIPGQFVYKDDDLVAIRDINPAAPVHVLVVPRRPIPSLAELEEGDAELMGKLMLAVSRIAREEGLERGYRVVINTGDEGGQTVPHLHVHILGGRKLTGHGTA
jgi:histidine triad (HIT) family protein